MQGKRSPGGIQWIIVLVAALGSFPLVPQRAAWTALAGAVVVLTYASARARRIATLHAGVLCSLILISLSAFGSMRYWPAPPAVAVLLYLILAKQLPQLGGLPPWLRRGKISAGSVLLVVASILVSSVALVGWFVLAKPDYQEVLHSLFPNLPAPVLFFGVVLFATFNAAIEELIYRGAVLGALDEALGPGLASLALQAALFGAVHINGFPRGLAGVGLATIYGVMMGVVRRRTRGLLAPWLAHVGTDIAIGAILISAL